jgi:excisionase family DNA binding protein
MQFNGSAEDLPLVLKVADVQRVINISRPMAYELMHRQDFPAVRFGRALRIPREAFLRWLDSQMEQKR